MSVLSNICWRICPAVAIILCISTWPVISDQICYSSEYRYDQLADLHSNGSDRPREFRRLNDRVVFEAYDGHALSLYSTDGRSIETIDFRGITRPFPEMMDTTSRLMSGRQPLPTFADLMFIVADGSNGRSLFKTDGNVATELASGVMGIVDYDVYYSPVAWPSDNFLYFDRTIGDHRELFRTDGSVVENADVTPGNNETTRFFAQFRGAAILDENGSLFRSGIGDAHEIVADRELSGFNRPIEFEGRLYYFADTGDGEKLYSTDGISSSDVDSSFATPEFSGIPIVAGDKLFFLADDDAGVQQVYYTDGSSVSMVPTESRRPQDRLRIIGSIDTDLFVFDRSRRRIFRTNGRNASDVITNHRSDVTNFIVKGRKDDTLFVDLTVADAGVAGSLSSGLFRLQGDTATLLDINNGEGYGTGEFLVFGDDVLFASTNATGSELFRLRGDTIVAFDINKSGHAIPHHLTVFDDNLFFSAIGAAGRELYSLDDDFLTTYDIRPGPAGSNPQGFIALSDELLISAETDDGRHVYRLSPIPAVPEPSSVSICLVIAVLMFGRLTRKSLNSRPDEVTRDRRGTPIVFSGSDANMRRV